MLEKATMGISFAISRMLLSGQSSDVGKPNPIQSVG